MCTIQEEIRIYFPLNSAQNCLNPAFDEIIFLNSSQRVGDWLLDGNDGEAVEFASSSLESMVSIPNNSSLDLNWALALAVWPNFC